MNLKQLSYLDSVNSISFWEDRIFQNMKHFQDFVTYIERALTICIDTVPSSSNIINEISTFNDQEIIKLAEIAINRDLLSGKHRDNALQLSYMIENTDPHAFDNFGSMNIRVYIADTLNRGIILLPKALKKENKTKILLAKNILKDVFIVIRALSIFSEKYQASS